MIFTNYIRPICLPSATDNVFNVDGVVVGRGRMSLSSMATSPTPLQAFLRTIITEDCLLDHDDAVIVVAKKSFCAVSDSQAPCQGLNLKNVLKYFLKFNSQVTVAVPSYITIKKLQSGPCMVLSHMQ